MSLQYNFSDKAKKATFAMMGVGVLAIVYAFVAHIEGQRIWANLLVNIFFFLTIGLGATFYAAKKYASEASYAIVYKRVYEAISGYVPLGSILLILFLVLGYFGVHHIYHWMDPEVYKSESPHYDKIIAGKAAYFNPIFFWGRIILFFAGYIYCTYLLRKRSLEEDLTGDIKLYKKNITTSAAFLVLFGFTSPILIWDVLMSIDTHWYTTLFAWYVFSGFWCTIMLVITLFSLYLKEKGHLQEMNDNHFHDLGKWIFALSFLWSYTFFCQYMLIWYANIPEEVTYYVARIDEFGYRPLFWIVFFINFSVPMLLLMSRDAKRNATYLMILSVVLILTHWLDLFMCIMPGSVAGQWGLGFFEIGLFIGFAGMFIFVVLNQLAKAPLLALKHPFLEESKHLHT